MTELLLGIAVYFLYRNDWVARQRLRMTITPPVSHRAMVYKKFWVWNPTKLQLP